MKFNFIKERKMIIGYIGTELIKNIAKRKLDGVEDSADRLPF